MVRPCNLGAFFPTTLEILGPGVKAEVVGNVTRAGGLLLHESPHPIQLLLNMSTPRVGYMYIT